MDLDPILERTLSTGSISDESAGHPILPESLDVSLCGSEISRRRNGTTLVSMLSLSHVGIRKNAPYQEGNHIKCW
jgi:hypothetical protein